jgi:hypothetical protein
MLCGEHAKSLGYLTIVVSPEGIEACVRRSANRLTAHDFWLQVADSQWVSRYPEVDGRPRVST